MKRVLLALTLLPVIVSNNSSASVKTKVTNEVSGENASVKTEINNVVNQKSVNIETTGPGTIKVEIKDGQINIEPDNITPTIIISPLNEETEEEIKEGVKEKIEEVEEETKTINKFDSDEIKKRITSFFKNIFSGFARIFRIKLDN